MKYIQHGTEGVLQASGKSPYALSCLSPYQKRWTKNFWRNLQVSLLAIPVMYRTCSTLGLAMFDIIRQYTDIKLSCPCPRLTKIKTISSGCRHRKVLVKKWHVAVVKEWISHYSSSSESDRTSSVTCPLLFNCLIIIKHMSFHQYIWNTSNVRSIVFKM